VAHQCLEPGSEFRLRDELPGPGNAGQSVAAVSRFVVLRQLLEARGELAVLHFLKRTGDLVAFGVFDSGREHVTQLFQAQRLLSREQDRLQNVLQFHAKTKATGRWSRSEASLPQRRRSDRKSVV